MSNRDGNRRPGIRSKKRIVGVGRGTILGMLAVLLWLGVPTWAAAQDAGRAPQFSVNVVDVSADSKQIMVPVNRSVIVETSIEIARADAVASQVADVAAVSPKQLLISGKTFGNTQVILWDAKDNQYVLEIAVELDLARLNEVLPDIDPQGNIEAKSLMGNILLVGTVSSAERAKRIVELANLFLPLGGASAGLTVQNHLQVAGEQQVMLRCVVAEVSRKATRELGVNGFLAGDNVADAFLVNQLGGINPANIGAAADALVTNRIPFLTGENGIPLNPSVPLSLGFPRLQMQLFIKAMADNGLVSVLAEPNLVTISGETATFLAGGEFPIPVPQGQQQVTIEFREFGVRLNFTPVVLAHQQIRLRVAPEVSELDFAAGVQIEGFSVPGLTTRAAETTVEIGSGQTIAIAGLLNERVHGLSSRIPGLGDVPVLGALFRSMNFQRSLSELVILVTPEIVAPLDPHQLEPLPTDGVLDPSDFELYALGLLEPWDVLNPQRGDGSGSPNGSEHLIGSEPEEMSVHGPWGHEGVLK